MKYMRLTALDYGCSFAHDKGILQMVDRERLSAVAVLTVSSLWPRQSIKLKKHIDGNLGYRPKVGISFSLHPNFKPLTEKAQNFYKKNFPTSKRILNSLSFSRRYKAMLVDELYLQYERFVLEMNRLPDFFHVPSSLLYSSVFIPVLINLNMKIDQNMMLLANQRMMGRKRCERLQASKYFFPPNVRSMIRPIEWEQMEDFFNYGLHSSHSDTMLLLSAGFVDERLLAYDSDAWEREVATRFILSNRLEQIYFNKDYFLF